MHKAVFDAGQILIEPEVLIEFESQGRALLIGKQQQIMAALPELESLHVYCVVLDQGDISESEMVTVVRQQLQSLSGWLGAFNAQFSSDNLTVDLVLDLSEQPVITTAVPPLGYYAPKDEAALTEVLQQLSDMTGIFDKPKFFNYKASICAHSRRGVTGCSQCIEACPAVAIESSGEDSVVVNPNLCQGCGSCTVVCPSGAMTYALPSLDVSINRLRKMMQTYFELENAAPHILIHDESHGRTLLEEVAVLPESIIPFSIEEIGALGMAFWLSALAYGAGKVSICDALTHDVHDWHELQQQISLANQLLASLDYGEQRIGFFKAGSVDDLIRQIESPVPVMTIEHAQFAGIDDKRRITTMALSHLHQQSVTPVDVLNLSDGAPFGEISIDKEKCTLCMSCVAVCPVGAVLDGVDKPQLNFIEDLCVQCGLCETACPEDALDLVSRYVFDRDQARKKRVLLEEPIFHCISCNKPFATQKMIDTIMAKLTDHPMFQGEAKQRLMMCEDCRVKAMFNNSRGPM